MNDCDICHLHGAAGPVHLLSQDRKEISLHEQHRVAVQEADSLPIYGDHRQLSPMVVSRLVKQNIYRDQLNVSFLAKLIENGWTFRSWVKIPWIIFYGIVCGLEFPPMESGK